MSRTKQLVRFSPASFDCRGAGRDAQVLSCQPLGISPTFWRTRISRQPPAADSFSVGYLTGFRLQPSKESVAWRLDSRVLWARRRKVALGWRKLLIRKQRGIVFPFKRPECPIQELGETQAVRRVNGGKANGIER
jgi:hypothetical protein